MGPYSMNLLRIDFSLGIILWRFIQFIACIIVHSLFFMSMVWVGGENGSLGASETSI